VVNSRKVRLDALVEEFHEAHESGAAAREVGHYGMAPRQGVAERPIRLDLNEVELGRGGRARERREDLT
jgi:hypothetical protein